MLELKKILEAQGWCVERESETAFFYNFAPWIAPKAYLHIVFKGADGKLLNEVGDHLMRLPRAWLDVLSVQNGAILFSGAISLYGANSPTALLNRADVFNLLPFSIESENRNWPAKPIERFTVLGGYGYDGTRAVLDREDGSVLAVPRKSEVVIHRWPDPDTWIIEELRRISYLFDANGKIQTSEQQTVPN